MQPLEIELTAHELHLLLGFFAPCAALGVENPYLGLFADEIRAEQTEALQSLIDRDCIRVETNGEVSIDETIARIIRTCANPAHSAIVSSQKANETKEFIYLHFTDNLVVELAPTREKKYFLKAYDERKQALERLGFFWGLESQRAATGGRFVLAESSVFTARDLVADGKVQDALKFLSKQGLKKQQAEKLNQTFSNAVSNSAVVVVVNRQVEETQYTKGLAMLAGQRDMWALEIEAFNDENLIAFIPCSASQILERLRSVLP